MPATTIRAERDVKEEFDRLLGLYQMETGDRLSQSELLERLLAIARRHEGELFRDPDAAWRPPTPEQLEALFAGIEDWGVETDASRIDEVLYGGGAD